MDPSSFPSKSAPLYSLSIAAVDFSGSSTELAWSHSVCWVCSRDWGDGPDLRGAAGFLRPRDSGADLNELCGPGRCIWSRGAGQGWLSGCLRPRARLFGRRAAANGFVGADRCRLLEAFVRGLGAVAEAACLLWRSEFCQVICRWDSFCSAYFACTTRFVVATHSHLIMVKLAIKDSFTFFWLLLH